MSKFTGSCVFMGTKSRMDREGKREYKSAALFFSEDCSTIEVSIPETRLDLWAKVQKQALKPCRVTVSVREFKGSRFVDLLECFFEGEK